MMKNWRSLFFLSILFTPTLSSALIMEVNPVVILNAAAPTQQKNGGSLSWTGNVATGFGILTAFSLWDSDFDLEVGAVYLDQVSERDNAGIPLKQDTHNLHIPVLIRYNFDERMAVGVGAYTSFANGSITTEQSGSTNYASYNSSGIHNRDFGLLLSARASLMIVPQLYFIVDGRYQHGLSNLANVPPGIPGDVLNTRSMQAYLGLSYRFMPF